MMKLDAHVAAAGKLTTDPDVHVGTGTQSRGSMMKVDARGAAEGELTTDPDAHVGAAPQSRGSMMELGARAAGGKLTTTDPDAHVGAIRSAELHDGARCAGLPAASSPPPIRRPRGRDPLRGAGRGCEHLSERRPRLDAAILRTQAKAALTGLGWKPAIANAAVAVAAVAQGEDVTLERLIFEALRDVPRRRREASPSGLRQPRGDWTVHAVG